MKLKLCTALITAASILTPLSIVAQKVQNSADAKRDATAVYGKLPLSFEPVEGSGHFLARSGGYAVSIGARESSVVVSDKSGKSQMLRFAFENANSSAPLNALEQQPGVTNYYIGRDASKWRLGVKNYAKVRAQGVYPGVDVVYYGDHRRLEFDFVVAPKADPSAIALSFSGMSKLSKDSSGDLVAELGGEPIHFVKPYAYQKIGGSTKPVDADYELAANGAVHLRLGAYDRTNELIVDPVVTYASYLGGNGLDVANGIAVDTSGNAYITGQTCSSAGFPKAPSLNPSGYSFQGACDAYVTKFSYDFATVEYTTLLGGSNPANATAVGNAIALDTAVAPALPNVYIVVTANVWDLPVVATSGNPKYGDSDAYIAILSNTGTLTRSSYLGGSSADSGFGIAVDQNSNVIVVGQTCSGDFPGYNSHQPMVEPCVAFATKLDNHLDIGYPYNIPSTTNPPTSCVGPTAPAGPPPAGAAYCGATALSAPPPSAPNGGTYYFSEFFGGQPVAPVPPLAWQPYTNYMAGALVSDNQSPSHVEFAENTGTSGPYTPATSTTSIPIPNWNTVTLGKTTDGGITWVDVGAIPTKVPVASTEAYGVALDPPGDVFFVGGTDSAYMNQVIWDGNNFPGSGAWIVKVSGQNGEFIYGWMVGGSATDRTGAINTSRAVAVDSMGRAYVVGTLSGGLKNSGVGYSSTSAGADAFLTRISQSGTFFDYATYLGGSGEDQGLGVAVDGNFQAYVTGLTKSMDFPVINPIETPTLTDLPLDGTTGAFVSKFTNDGSALVFSSYMGGSQSDWGTAIAVAPASIIDHDSTDTSFNMYVAGNSNSTDLVSNLVAAPYSPAQPTNAGNGDAFLAMIKGAGIPTVTLSPGSLSFPYQNVGVTGTALAISYVVNGGSAVHIQDISFNNSEFSQQFMGGSGSGADCTWGPITAGCTLWVVFTPSAQGQRSGILTITDDATSKPHTINLYGVGAAPIDIFSASNLVFTSQVVSTTSAAKTETLTNSGQGILTITSVTPSGEFSLDPTTTCLAGTQLQTGGTCIIGVDFAPTATGLQTGTLTIIDNAPNSPHNIPLSGTGVGVSPGPSINPSSQAVTFGSQAVGTTSATQTVTLTNPAAVSLIVQQPVLGGTVPGDFSQNNNCGTLSASGGYCTVNVTFTPTAVGTRAATLVFTDNATTSPQTVTLNGTGYAVSGASGTISLSSPATPLVFTTTALGTTSATQTVTLTNSSSTAALSSISSVTDNSDFQVQTSGTCGSSLAAGASCTIVLAYLPPLKESASVPTESAPDSATLTVTASSSNSPQTLSLQGYVGSSTTTTADYTLTPSTTGQSITKGATANFSVVVAPQNGFTGPISFTCLITSASSGSLPCTLTPASFTMDGTSAFTMNVSINTSTSSAKSVAPRFFTRSIFFALLPFSMLGMLFIHKRRGSKLVLAVLAACLLMGLASCGTSSGSSSSSGGSQVSYNVTITSSLTNSADKALSLSLVVNPQ